MATAIFKGTDDDIKCKCFNNDDNIEDDIVDTLSSKRPCRDDRREYEDSDLAADVAVVK